MKKELILVDADGVLFEWEPAFTKWMLARGFKELPDASQKYKIHKRFDLDKKINTWNLVKEFNESEEIAHLEPLRDSVEYVKKLSRLHGYRFHCITSLSTEPTAVQRRQKNLDTVFGEGVFERLICLQTGADKDQVLEEYRDTGCFWCEDKYANAEAGLALGLTPLLVEHEHNKDYRNPKIKTVKNWKEIYEIILNDL